MNGKPDTALYMKNKRSMQESDYYTVTSKGKLEGKLIYKVSLHPEASVYDGHFPGNPVSPGVCNVQMITECASDAAGQALQIQAISKCRFLSVVTPEKSRELWIGLELGEPVNGKYTVAARINDGDKICVDFKGELGVKEE